MHHVTASSFFAIQRHRINILRLVFVCLLPLLIFTRSAWEPYPAIHEISEVSGAILIIFGVLGRFWSILYSGGRKNKKVVQNGPYSICRHPLYLFSTMAIFGFGVLIGSLVVAFLLGGLTLIILLATAHVEEDFLLRKFGDDYRTYRHRVPAIIPDIRLFNTPEKVTFFEPDLRGNFRDALVFLGFLPLAELIKFPSETGIIPSIALW